MERGRERGRERGKEGGGETEREEQNNVAYIACTSQNNHTNILGTHKYDDIIILFPGAPLNYVSVSMATHMEFPPAEF